MNGSGLITGAKNNWCPGCGNFVVQRVFRDVLTEMVRDGQDLENFVIVAGIGQHGKMFDYINVNGFYSIHGRTVPVATGISLANPDLKVICFAGDGDAYAEGLDHMIFGAKRNVDTTLLVHDNRVYALTTGQYTPTSPEGYKGRSTPRGAPESSALNPLEIALISGATFIGRGYTGRMDQLKQLIRQAIEHRGFSFIDILQICVTYYNMTQYYNAHVYDWDENGVNDFAAALTRAREWDYNTDARIGLGVLYKRDAPTFGDKYPLKAKLTPAEREEKVREILEGRT